MDPVLRVVSDTRRLRSEVGNPFDRNALIEYLCRLAEEMGFKGVKNVRHNTALLDCAWKDGNSLFLGANIEFGSEREILGAVAQIIIAQPEVGVLITASNPLKPITNIIDAIRRTSSIDFAIVDVKTGNSATVRRR